MSAVPMLPSSGSARLPERYEAARQALAECSRIDECQDWADTAAALASYARQRDDETLRKYADRIRARAIRRCGELLKQIPSGQGASNQYKELPDGTVTRHQAAADAGISERKKVTALRVANIDPKEFERQVEGDQPPTIGELARQGTEPKTSKPSAAEIESQKALAQLIALSRFCATHNAAAVANALRPDRLQEARRAVDALDRWLDEFSVNLGG